MKGDTKVIEFLNQQLTGELTAINQYFLHAKMQENLGWSKLAEHTKAESIDEMRHAEALTDRILFLAGLPNYQRLGTIRIGQTASEMFEADMADRGRGRHRVARRYRAHAPGRRHHFCAALRGHPQDEEHHIDYLETQLALIQQLGEALYLAKHVDPPTG